MMEALRVMTYSKVSLSTCNWDSAFFMGMGLRMGRAGGDEHDGGEAIFSLLLRQLLAGG